MKIAGIVLGVLVLFALWFVFLAGSTDYPDHDSRELSQAELLRATETLLEESEAWPVELSSEGVVVSSSLEPHPVRTVRYTVDVNAPFEKAIEFVKEENYSGPERREKADKWEQTMYQKDGPHGPEEWVCLLYTSDAADD